MSLFAPKFPDWPKLDWKCPATKADAWLDKRTFEIAALARRFELAFTVLAEEGKLDLGAVDMALLDWDKAAAQILAYTIWGEAKRVPSDPKFVRNLEQIYLTVGRARLKVLGAFGRSEAAAVVAREEQLMLDPKALRPAPASPIPTNFARFTGEFQAFTTSDAFKSIDGFKMVPVSADEVLKRTSAESKMLPESRQLGALLAILPSEWVNATFEQLKLKLDEDAELSAASRSSAKRGAIYEFLMKPENLAALVGKLKPEEQELLTDLLVHEGWLPYRRLRDAYGLDESDGFYWNTRPPAGPLSKLRRRALAFVGTRNGTPMVTVPTDLSKALIELMAKRAPG
ncbi:MAG TPA: hypothetical protein VGK67_18885 [Myxococcales bacterium]|jgi:hypothetical protein